MVSVSPNYTEEARESMKDLRIYLNVFDRLNGSPEPKLKVDVYHEAVIQSRRVSLLLVKGCSLSIGPPILKPNNFPDLPHQAVFLPPHDDK